MLFMNIKRGLPLSLCAVLAIATDGTSITKSNVEIFDIDKSGASVTLIPTQQEVLKVVTDPKNPVQPIPASDGADYIKNIPGFSVIRKGGTDGDPVFRGMSGSKVGILADGQEVYGGCGGRMDPPTSYIYPEQYDRVTVTKGPQSVLFGSGFSAGVVQFEKKPRYFTEPTFSGYSTLKQGSYGRSDQLAEALAGTKLGYIQVTGVHSHSDDYKSGNGDTIRSEYTRWNYGATIGFTPDESTLVEVSLSKGDGESKYADRTMDASKLYRENISLKVAKYDLSRNVNSLEFSLYYNYVDHIMDNYSLRTNANTATSYSAMNPDRTTKGWKAKIATSIPSLNITNISGIDYKNDVHTNKNAMGKASGAAVEAALEATARSTDFDFKQMGFFDETTFALNQKDKIVAGLRIDKHEVLDERAKLGILIFNNPNYNTKDKATLKSGFIRYENDNKELGLKSYIGFGHSERFPDYWERTKYNLESITVGTTNVNAITFQAIPKPEKTNQIDVGTNWKKGDLSGSVSLFYSKVNDYIQNRWLNTNGTAITVPYYYGLFLSTTSYTKVANIDATLYGGELDMTYKIAQNYKLIGALAYVHGQNDTENKPLAQQPPLELKLSAVYDDSKYSAGFLARLVSSQDRYDFGNGSIVMNGVDKGKTPSFAVFSVNGGYKYNKYVSLSAGIDNILNKNYAEHLSNNNTSSAAAYINQTRIYELGRNFWFEAKMKF